MCQQELDSHGGTIYYVNSMVVARRIRLIYKRPTESDSWLVVWEHTKPYKYDMSDICRTVRRSYTKFRVKDGSKQRQRFTW